MKARITPLFLSLILLICILSGQIGSALELSTLSYAPDLIQRAGRLRPMEVEPTVDISRLEPWERQVLEKLIQAADTIDALYWQQMDPVGAEIFRSLTGDDPETQAARVMLDGNYGRWDRFDHFFPFLGSEARPPGGHVYPPDLTRQELDAYLAEYPEQTEDLLSPFTVVRRSGERLEAIPYHRYYASFVEPAAALLGEAAAISRNATLTRYLSVLAEALLTDDYFEANLAWLELDGNLDLSFGPHESYDDYLTGQKAFYKANVLVVDQEASALFEHFRDTIPAQQANLPVPEAFRPPQTGTLMPIVLADDIYRTGQARAFMISVGFSLPNDPRVLEARGAKTVLMRNFMNTRRAIVLESLLQAIFDRETNRWSSAQGYLNLVLMHEIAHTLGPRMVIRNGQEMTIRQALGEYYLPIEEGKADITALYNIARLREQGLIDEPLEAHYAGFLSEALRSIRFGPASVYGLIRSAAWNFFTEQGALLHDPDSNRFQVDANAMTRAVEALMVTLITLEGEGDPGAAKNFLDRYASVPRELRALLDQAEATLPLEFLPRQKGEFRSQ